MELNAKTTLHLQKGTVVNLDRKPDVKLNVYIGEEESNEDYAAVLIKADGTIERPTEEDMRRVSEIDKRMIGKHISVYVPQADKGEQLC